MAYPPIPSLPAAPQRGDIPSNYADIADAFTAALPGWGTAINTFGNWMQAQADLITSGFTAAIAAPGTSGTSVTALRITAGSCTLTTQTGKDWVVGMTMIIAATAAPTNRMIGVITAYDSETGSLVVEVAIVEGTGTYDSWTVSISGVANITAVSCSGNASTATTAWACTGNAATASKLQNIRTIGGANFDGSASINLPGVNQPGNQPTSGNAGSASKLLDSDDGSPMAFHWNGQAGTPPWVWGGSNGTDMYVYNPANFSVAYAGAAGNADTIDGYHASSFKRVATGYDGVGTSTIVAIYQDTYSYAVGTLYSLSGLSGGWRCTGRCADKDSWRIYIFEKEY